MSIMANENNDVFISFSFKDYDKAKEIVDILEKKYGLKVWMCSKELLGGDKYYAIIPGVIRDSKVFILIQSENALKSKEIPSEILVARNARKTIIPFVIDNVDVEDSEIEYFLLPLQYIDATVPTLEKRIDELSQSIYSVISQKGDVLGLNIVFRNKLLSTNKVFPVKTFVGRESLIEDIHRYYLEGHNVVFISGIGGIGKTEIAKKYASDHKEEYDTVIYLTYEDSFQSLIINESNFKADPEINRKIKSSGELETDEEFFNRKLKVIKALSNNRTLIIIDNFPEEYKEEYEQLFIGPYRLLITTRGDYSSSDYPVVYVNPLDKPEELKALFFNNYEENVVNKSDNELLTLFELVKNHTYTIKLIAKHMDMSLETTNEMIKALSKEGIKSLNEEIKDEKSHTSTAYNNLLKMYQLSKLSPLEIDALRFMLFAPIEGLPSIYIKRWGGSDIYHTIKELEKRSWVLKTNTGYSLHPIVYEIVKNNVSLDYSSCKDFLSNYQGYIHQESSWNFLMMEKEIYASFAYKFLEYFPKITPEIEELYYDIECLLSFSVNPVKSLELSHLLYDYFLLKVGEDDYYTVRSAYKIGWNHIFNRQLPDSLNEARKWIILAFNKFQKINRPLSTYEKMVYYNCYRHIAKVYQFSYQLDHQEEDYKLALKYALESVDKLTKESDEELKISRLPSMYIQVADVYLAHKEYEEALKYEIFSEESYGREDDDLLYRLTRKAKCYVGLKRYKEALELANECISGYLEKDGKYHITTLETYNIILDCHKALGNIEQAKDIESIIASIRKALFVE